MYTGRGKTKRLLAPDEGAFLMALLRYIFIYLLYLREGRMADIWGLWEFYCTFFLAVLHQKPCFIAPFSLWITFGTIAPKTLLLHLISFQWCKYDMIQEIKQKESKPL